MIKDDDVHDFVLEREDWEEKKPLSSDAVLGEVRLTKDELNILRQWYNAVEDLNNAYLNDEDKKLYDKIQAHLA